MRFTQDIADEIVQFAENFKSRGRHEISFVEMNRSQPYTGYSPEFVEAYRQAAKAKGTDKLRGPGALLRTIGSMGAKSVGDSDKEKP